MHYLYIIYSKLSDKFYIRETHDLEERLEKHKNHTYDNSFTKIASDWILVLKLECNERKDALYLEQFIKRMKSKKFIDKVVNEPSIPADILSKK